MEDVLEQYVLRLKSHDWYYEYSDDHNVWSRGIREKDDLRRLQEKYDINYEIWNKYAPDMFKRQWLYYYRAYC